MGEVVNPRRVTLEGLNQNCPQYANVTNNPGVIFDEHLI